MSLRIPSSAPGAPRDNDSGTGGASQETAGPPAGIAPAGGFFTQEIAEPKRRFTGSMVLAVVILAAGGVLVAMRQFGLGPGAELATVKIDYPLDEQNQLKTDHVKVLTDLQATDEVKQVPLEEIQMNPFEWRALKPKESVKAGRAEVDPEELSRKQLEAQRQKIIDAASRLELNSVIGGRVPLARISGDMVKVGDVVGEIFTVTSITGRSVDLRAGEQTFTLTLGENK